MMNKSQRHYIKPNWPAPPGIEAVTTTRQGGSSIAPYSGFNLAVHCGDDPASVLLNRQQLRQDLALPAEPLWLKQTHTNIVVTADNHDTDQEADGMYSHQAGQSCVVMTADCLPILLCDQTGSEIAALHAGWRGLANGIIENGIKHFHSKPATLLAWLGPAIGPQQFEVGTMVRDAFVTHDLKSATAFIALADDKWLANLYQLATQRLQSLGVTQIFGGDYCTVSDPQQFYSYRRDGAHTGRMASLILRR